MGHLSGEAEFLLNDRFKLKRDIFFAMDYEDLRLACKSTQPFKEVFLIGMGRKSAYGIYLCPYGHFFSEYTGAPCSIDDMAPQRSSHLITGEYDAALGPPYVMFEVMLYTSAFAHAAAGYNDKS